MDTHHDKKRPRLTDRSHHTKKLHLMQTRSEIKVGNCNLCSQWAALLNTLSMFSSPKVWSAAKIYILIVLPWIFILT